MQKIRFWLENNVLGWGIFWHVVIAVLLAAAVFAVNVLLESYAPGLPSLLKASSEQTQTMLLTLAGALMTVTIFLYSTTVVVLTTYSAQFTPRVIENFSNNKSISRIFGIFIGGTIYCVLSLLLMDRSAGSVTLLAAAVAMLYTLLGVFHFIMFIIQVSQSVQVQNLLSTLSKQASETIGSFTAIREKSTTIEAFGTDGFKDVFPIKAKGNGFFEENDFGRIERLLSGEDCMIVLYPRLGDFVSENEVVADLHHNGIEVTEELECGLAESLILEEKRFIDNDYRFAIQKIVEVALKALSASINDPNTAIYSLRHLGVLSGQLARVEGRYTETRHAASNGKCISVIDQDFIFHQDLRDIFAQIVHYGKTDLYVVVAVLEALYTAWLVAATGNKPAIEAMVSYVFASIDGQFADPVELRMLDEKKGLFPPAGTSAEQGILQTENR